MALHKESSDKLRQSNQELQSAISGPQQILGPQKAEP